MDSKKILHDTITELFQQAARDGIITDAERAIIDQVEIDVKKYGQVLDQVMEDGVIDSEEHKRLEALAKAVMDDAEETARADGVINRNEKDLLLKLHKVVHRYFEMRD